MRCLGKGPAGLKKWPTPCANQTTRLASVLVRTFVNLKKANHRGCLHLLEVVRCPPTKSKEISSVSFVFYIKCPGGADVSGESSSPSPLECNLRRET